MAKASLQFTVPAASYAAFQTLGAAMVHCGVQPFRQEGWTLKGQESVGLFRMGYPVTVTATVHPEGAGSRITMDGENMGIAFNRIHIERVLSRIGEAVQHAVAAIPPMPATPPVIGTETPRPETGPDHPNLPPRLG